MNTLPEFWLTVTGALMAIVSALRATLLGAPSGLAMWTKEMVAGTDPSPDLPDERPLRRGSGSAD